LVGLGNSSISDIYYGYAQNAKEINTYKEAIQLDELAIQRGHVMDSEDIATRNLILDLICNQRAQWTATFFDNISEENLNKLHTFESEGLIYFNEMGIQVLDKGLPFVRNICTDFDLRMKAKQERQFVFSKAI
jgi:oxygen-independent coproporphyrinogen-3 oxidase